jgi:hypothetical protein
MKLNLLLILFHTCTLFAQVDKDVSFIEKFKQVKLPLVIDELTIDSLLNKESISYNKIARYLVSENEDFALKIEDTISNKLYPLVKFFKGNDLNLIILLLNKTLLEENLIVYQFIYDSNIKLFSFKEIAYISKRGGKTKKKLTLLSYDNIINFKSNDENHLEEIIYSKYKKRDGFFPFDTYNCDELSECVYFKPKKDSIPHRPIVFKSWIFDRVFYKNNISYIPFKYCSTDSITQVLSSIESSKKKSLKGYFLDSKRLKDDGRIIFFLNIYSYENHKIVKEVGCQIFNKNGKLIRRYSFGLYALDQNNIEMYYSSNVSILGDKLVIESDYPGFEKEVFEIMND